MGWLIAAIIVVLLVLAYRLSRLATRLDRLHRRTEAAWAALDVALARRSGVARALGGSGGVPPEIASAISGAAHRTDIAVRSERADAENALTKALEQLTGQGPPGIRDELIDAAQRVMLARRFYNDAVRDTRALRSDRFSRTFRLAGRAQLPDYFEIAEYNPAAPLTRISARIVLVDATDRVLLLSGADPGRPGDSWWFTPGGGVEPGEDLLSAARRELAEETSVGLGEFAGPLWWRRAQFSFVGVGYDQTEYYFAARLPVGAVISADGYTELERAAITGTRWWTLDELRATTELIYPLELAQRLPEALAAARGLWTAADPVEIA
jgi:8-oxo-dGTP pyrophosphatase MutT (NUDIX family)